MNLKDSFHAFARGASEALGSPYAFAIAILCLFIWGVSGPFFDFSDTWQLVINTATTIVTFLMVFLIQNTQNRDARAIHLKLDELLKAHEGARDSLVDLEDMTNEELDLLQEEFERVRKGLPEPEAGEKAKVKLEKRKSKAVKAQAKGETKKVDQ